MTRQRVLDDGVFLQYRDPASGDPEFRRVLPDGRRADAPRWRAAEATPVRDAAPDDADLILFALRGVEAGYAGLHGPGRSGQVELVLVVDGVPRKAALDPEQAVALGLALLVANPRELENWASGDEPVAAPLPESS